MQNYELESEMLTNTKIEQALQRSQTIAQPPQIKKKATQELQKSQTTAASTESKPASGGRRGSLFPGELLQQKQADEIETG